MSVIGLSSRLALNMGGSYSTADAGSRQQGRPRPPRLAGHGSRRQLQPKAKPVAVGCRCSGRGECALLWRKGR
jgi:hypothetical protein